jgi:hypothetical protein
MSLFQKFVLWIHLSFLKSFIFPNMNPTKIYCNVNNLKIDNVNFEYDFMF